MGKWWECELVSESGTIHTCVRATSRVKAVKKLRRACVRMAHIEPYSFMVSEATCRSPWTETGMRSGGIR